MGLPLKAQERTRTEHEPNDSSASATPATIGDTLIGAFSPYGDQDYYAFDITAGTKLEFKSLTKRCVIYSLQGPGGGFGGGDRCDDVRTHGSREILVSGRYTLRLLPYEEGSGGEYAVTLRAYTAPPPGPGGPTRLFATGFRETNGLFVRIDGMTADWSGGLYVATDNVINHVSANGDVKPFVHEHTGFGAMVVDGFGDLLVGGTILLGDGHSRGVVWRFAPSGERSVFADAPGTPSIMFTGIAIGPDGDVWFVDPGMDNDSKLWRFDPAGNLKEKIDVSATGRAWNMAMSPRGQIHYVNQQGDVYKLVGTTPQRVGHATLTFYGNPLAFDRDGYPYGLEASAPDPVGDISRPSGKVLLFDPQFNVVTDPFAQVLDSLEWSGELVGAGPTFLRDAAGTMTSRIMVTRWRTVADSMIQILDDSALASVRELNGAAVRAPGADIVPRLQHVQLVSNRTATVGAGYADTLRMPGTVTGWELVAGRLPRGVTLDSQTGVLSGMPAEPGSFDFTVRGTAATIGYGRFVLAVSPAAFAVADIANALLGGPALPDSTARFLDQFGNGNGILDAGDLRAWSRAQGQLPGAGSVRRGASRIPMSRTMTRAENDRLRALVIRGRP